MSWRNRPRTATSGIVLGTRLDSPRREPLYLSAEHQAYHATIWGQSGSGKSRFLQSLFLQHLNQGHGVALIDPHSDLSLATLSYLLESGFFADDRAYERLVYLDFTDDAFVPLNVLAARGSPQTVALHTLEAMLRVWPELHRAPSFQTLVLAGMTALIHNHLPVTCLHQLLTDAAFRARCLEKMPDPLIHQTFARLGQGRGQAQEAGSALRRAFLLSFHDATRLTLGQPDRWLDIRQLMDDGRSVIVNLGTVADTPTRQLLGALLLVQIEQAALSRTDLPADKRRPWTVLVDEWGLFSAHGATLGSMLDQTRKYGLRLYLAAQSSVDVSSDRLHAALENCKLTVAMGLGYDSAGAQAKALATIDFDAVKANPVSGRPQHLSPGEQVAQLAQHLRQLRPQEAYVKIHTDAPVRIETLSVPDSAVNPWSLEQVILTYRRRYQRPRAEAEKMFSRNFRLTSPSSTTTEQESTVQVQEQYQLFQTYASTLDF